MKKISFLLIFVCIVAIIVFFVVKMYKSSNVETKQVAQYTQEQVVQNDDKEHVTDEVKKKEKVMQKTFAIIKPSGASKTIEIKSIIQSYGLKILKAKKIIMTEKKFNKLYYMHKDKPFFNDLKASLVGQEVEVMVLYGDNAVERYREAVSDIRAKYAINKTENAVHGSDSWKRAHEEICIFFEC